LEKLGLGENPLLASAESVTEAADAHSKLYFFRHLGGSGGMEARLMLSISQAQNKNKKEILFYTSLGVL
jgi:hypothetical protein